jgi:hypothetical protein
MSQATTVKEVLTAARWMIENVGWCQGSYYISKDEVGCFNPSFEMGNASNVSCMCASGAVYLVEATKELQNQSLDFLWGTIGVGTEVSVPDWNDQPKRTKEQVLAAFDRAIEKA